MTPVEHDYAEYFRALAAVRRRQRLRVAALVATTIAGTLIALFLLTGCAPKTLSPRGQALYTSITFVDALHALQSAAIDGNKLGVISDADSVAIVRFTRASALTIQQVPDGWRPAVIAGWDELSKLIPPERLQASTTLRILWVSVASTIAELRKGA